MEKGTIPNLIVPQILKLKKYTWFLLLFFQMKDMTVKSLKVFPLSSSELY